MFYVGISAQRKGLCSHDFHRGGAEKKRHSINKNSQKNEYFVMPCPKSLVFNSTETWELTPQSQIFLAIIGTQEFFNFRRFP